MVLSPVRVADAPLESVLSRLRGVRRSQHGWLACCPAHKDGEPSLSIGLGDEGHILLKCFAGCSLELIVGAMDMTVAELFPSTPAVSDPPSKLTQRKKLELVDLAQEKHLPWKYLFRLGVTEQRSGCLHIPYHLQDGTLAPRHRLRTALVAKEGSHWSKGQGEIVPYGLERLEEARKAGYLVLAEGESDCWTLWLHQFPALGLPGAEMVRTLKADYLDGIEKLYIVRESDAAGARFVTHIKLLLEKWKWNGKAFVVSLVDAKDPNELHKRDWKGFKAAFQQALDRAEPLGATKAQPAPSSSEYIPAPFTLPELLARQLPPIQWTIPDILPEGLSILAGKPKLGKSWLALGMALSVAAGGVALGSYPVTQGEVLYLALEDNERRLQSRAKQLLASMPTVPDTIAFELRWPRLGQGGLTYLETYLQTHPQLRLVVVDTWARISPKSKNRQRSQYEDDYEALTPLKYLADTYRVSILAIHHLRKMRGDDVLDEITGSIGLTGAVDGALILKRERGQHEATLFVTGRDIEQEQQFALRFDPFTAMWTQVGNVEEVKRSKERQEILDLLTEQLPEGMSARQVTEALGKNYHTTRCLLHKLEATGEISHVNNHYVATAGENSHNHYHHCNQHHQTEPSAQHTIGPIEHGEESCLPSSDYTDYGDDACEKVSGNKSRKQSIPPFGGCSLPFSATSEKAPPQSEVVPHVQDQRDDDVTSVISRNHRNHSLSPASQVSTSLHQSIATKTDESDYGDYGDDSDYAHEGVSSCWFQQQETDLAPTGTSLRYQPEAGVLATSKHSEPDVQDHRVDYADIVINRNHRNHSDLHFSQTTLQAKRHESGNAPDSNDISPGKARASPVAQSKKRCLHHPYAGWIRFDPSGQGWCDKMDCWDSYRLMKIGEALDYRPLAEYTRGIVKLEQGIEAWSSFVTSQGSFGVLTATQYAIDFCKALGVEVPDLSGEVKRLVSAWE
jgi:AAA domain